MAELSGIRGNNELLHRYRKYMEALAARAHENAAAIETTSSTDIIITSFYPWFYMHHTSFKFTISMLSYVSHKHSNIIMVNILKLSKEIFY